ncbi:MAG TPA: branched-chain amino acid ABC transporter permease [Beijerinckiaceae bacterium]|nr:branched-chain amino acid ABC transporter permease [Beijerinckiaceae bacterium]
MTGAVAGVLYDGFAYGMLLFLLSVGLSVTLGTMNFVNLAHGSFAMVGGYVAVTLMNRLNWPFLAALPAAFVSAALISMVLERVLFRRFYRASDLDQCLLTIGIVFVSIASAAYLFGTQQEAVRIPDWLAGSYVVGAQTFGIYRLFLIVVALALAALLVGALEFTRFGAKVRAAVDNQRMARGLGVDVDRAFALTFALGGGLAGLGGALAIELVGLDHNFAFTYLIYVLIVVSVGGLGSIGGSFVAAALLGVSTVAGEYWAPQTGSFLIYFIMVAILAARPSGLFGKR